MAIQYPIDELMKEFGLIPAGPDRDRLGILATKINDLLENDFQKLISILYRMDISEAKLRLLLKDNPGSDAAMIIANMMIERQAQKIKSRQEHRRDSSISDEESW